MDWGLHGQCGQSGSVIINVLGDDQIIILHQYLLEDICTATLQPR